MRSREDFIRGTSFQVLVYIDGKHSDNDYTFMGMKDIRRFDYNAGVPYDRDNVYQKGGISFCPFT